MKRHVENESQTKTVEISMGTLFTGRSFGKKTNEVNVIIDIGDGDSFHSAELQKDGDNVYFGFGGGGGSENFDKIVGLMLPEDVIKAGELGARRLGYQYTQEQINFLLTSAQKGTRPLSLKPLTHAEGE